MDKKHRRQERRAARAASGHHAEPVGSALERLRREVSQLHTALDGLTTVVDAASTEMPARPAVEGAAP